MFYKWSEIKTWNTVKEFGLLRYQKGDFKCWVSPLASVGEGARVGDRASVGAGARVGDRARVGEWARVGDRARVGEGARVNHCFMFGPLGTENRYLHFMPETGMFSTGCFYGTEKELREASQKKHKGNKHGKAYIAAINGLKAMARAQGVKRDKKCDPENRHKEDSRD